MCRSSSARYIGFEGEAAPRFHDRAARILARDPATVGDPEPPKRVVASSRQEFAAQPVLSLISSNSVPVMPRRKFDRNLLELGTFLAQMLGKRRAKS